MHRKQFRHTGRHEAGWLMLEVSLALLVVAAYAAFKLSEDYDEAVNLHLRARVKALETVKAASEQYAARYYSEITSGGNQGAILTPGLAITVQVPGLDGLASYTVEDGHHPTIKDLVALNLLTRSFAGGAIGGGAYGIALESSPLGCAGADCNIEGIAFIDKPYQAAGKVDYALAGRSVQYLGADGMASLPRSPQIMSGYGGKFSLPNPVTPALAGLIGTRFEYRAPTKPPAESLPPRPSADTANAGQIIIPLRSPGDDCTTDGAIASGSSGVLFCSRGIYQEISPMGSQGDVCRTPGALVKDSDTLEALFCKNAVLVRLSNLLAKSVPHSNRRVTDGMRLPKPACEPGGVAAFEVSDTSYVGGGATQSRQVTATTSGKDWVIRLEGVTGAAPSVKGGAEETSALLDLVCLY